MGGPAEGVVDLYSRLALEWDADRGRSLIERAWLDKFEEDGFIDTFRFFHPEKKDSYTWWDMKTRARERNVGWRLDYFYVSDNLKQNLQNAGIMPDILGSDHCPIYLKISI